MCLLFLTNLNFEEDTDVEVDADTDLALDDTDVEAETDPSIDDIDIDSEYDLDADIEAQHQHQCLQRKRCHRSVATAYLRRLVSSMAICLDESYWHLLLMMLMPLQRQPVRRQLP